MIFSITTGSVSVSRFFGLFDFAGAGDQAGKVAIFVDHLRGGLDADAGCAGYIVG